MPVATGGPPPARQAIVIGLAVLLGLVAVVFLVGQFDQLGGGQQNQVVLDTPSFTPGETAVLAEAVAETGPLLFPGPTGSGRDLWLQHLGADPDQGWTAFAVQAPGAGHGCVTEWQPDARTFADSCDGMEFPEDGSGLVQYRVAINAGRLLTILLDPLPSN